MQAGRLEDIINPLGGDRSWYWESKCCRQPVGEYDSIPQSGVKGYDKSYRIIQVMEKCEGCPVIQQCAAQALQQRWTGVVAAGIELPNYHWYQKGFRLQHRSAMHEMAEGRPMHEAIGQHFGKDKTGWVVALIAGLRQWYINHYDRIPGPTPKRAVYPAHILAAKYGASRPTIERMRDKYSGTDKAAEYARIAEIIMALPYAEDQYRGGHE